MDKDIKNRLL